MRSSSILASVLLTAMVGSIVGCVSSEEKEQMVYAKVKVDYYVRVGDHHEMATREFADPEIIRQLMTFFPELTGRKTSNRAAAWKSKANLYFFQPDGEVIQVVTNFEFWNADHGDFHVRGDLAKYVKALFEQSSN